MSNFDQFNDVENPSLVWYPGDPFSFYANITELEDDANFDNWHLDLLDNNFNVIISDVGILTKDVITGSSYRFYSQFEVPTGLTPGVCYRLVIVDETYNLVKYVSNKFQYSSEEEYTVQIRYRNSRNIFNFNYEGLSSFYNEFRVRLLINKPSSAINAEGYEISDGSFKPVRYTKGRNDDFTTLWYDYDDHEGFEAAALHSAFECAIRGQWVAYTLGENAYETEWLGNYPLSDGIVTMQRKDSFSNNRTL
jgi:hypothetical protein